MTNQSAHTYTDLDGNPVEPPELNWLETGVDIEGSPCDRYTTGPESSVWLDDEFREVDTHNDTC